MAEQSSPLWDMIWMIAEEVTRKLGSEQRDAVLEVIRGQDEAQVAVLGRDGGDVLVRVGPIVFSAPIAQKTRDAEAEQELPSEVPRMERRSGST